MQTLQTMLPYVQQTQNNPDVSFHVTALSDIYVQKLGKTTTQIYLSKLKALASRSGERFEDVLKGMLVHVSHPIHEAVVPNLYPELALVEADDTLPAHSADLPQADFSLKHSQVPTNVARHHTVPPSPSLTVSDLNPHAVQKVVVEHLVCTSDFEISGNSPSRLCAFSGRTPCQPNEVDSESWHSSAELLFQDPMVSDFHRVCSL